MAIALIAVAVAAVTGVYAAGSAGAADQTTIRVGVFGDFGYKDLYAKYMKAHPNIVIKEISEDYAPHHENLVKHLATGAGAADIEAVEVGFIAKVASTPQYFVDLRKFGAQKYKSGYLPWKYDQAVAKDGALLGLGTDVGSLGICYRTDLFKQAGLPTDRQKVSALWPTWDDYIKVGQRFKAHAPKGTYFFDSASNVYNAEIAQLNPAYYDKSGKLLVATNPNVKKAFDLSLYGNSLGLDAGLTAFSSGWNTGFKKGLFATVTCPAWMMGYIQGQAPKTSGKWSIADVPGGKGGSWGGSFLTIPKQSKNQEEAYKLLQFLTSADSQKFVFKQTGNLSSLLTVLRSPSIQDFRKPFFGKTPVGAIFAKNALKLRPQILGPGQGDIQTAATNAMQRVEQKKQSPAQSWTQFLKDVKNVTST